MQKKIMRINKQRTKSKGNILNTLNRSNTSRLYISKADTLIRFVIIPDFVFKTNASDGNNS